MVNAYHARGIKLTPMVTLGVAAFLDASRVLEDVVNAVAII
jgi:hypothetical protein